MKSACFCGIEGALNLLFTFFWWQKPTVIMSTTTTHNRATVLAQSAASSCLNMGQLGPCKCPWPLNQAGVHVSSQWLPYERRVRSIIGKNTEGKKKMCVIPEPVSFFWLNVLHYYSLIVNTAPEWKMCFW